MTNPYRAMCAELVEKLHEHTCLYEGHESELVTRARALLAQPVAEGLTDEALVSFTAWFCKNYPGPDTIIHKPKWHAPIVFRAAAYAIARWGHPTPQPVPVSERPWEREGWCDEQGGCWWWNAPTYAAGTGWWSFGPWEWVEDATHCLPFSALPLPEDNDN